MFVWSFLSFLLISFNFVLLIDSVKTWKLRINPKSPNNSRMGLPIVMHRSSGFLLGFWINPEFPRLGFKIVNAAFCSKSFVDGELDELCQSFYSYSFNNFCVDSNHFYCWSPKNICADFEVNQIPKTTRKLFSRSNFKPQVSLIIIG